MTIFQPWTDNRIRNMLKLHRANRLTDFIPLASAVSVCQQIRSDLIAHYEAQIAALQTDMTAHLDDSVEDDDHASG